MIDPSYAEHVNSITIAELKEMLRIINAEKFPEHKELIETRIAELEKTAESEECQIIEEETASFESDSEIIYNNTIIPPTFGEAFLGSFKIFFQNRNLLFSFVVFLIPTIYFSHLASNPDLILRDKAIISVVDILWFGIWQIPFYLTLDEIIRGKEYTNKISITVKKIIPLLLMDFFFMLCLMGSSLLLIVPGIMFGIATLYYKQAMILEDKGIFESFSYSWKLTKGYRWDLFGLTAILFAIQLAISIVLFIFDDYSSKLNAYLSSFSKAYHLIFITFIFSYFARNKDVNEEELTV